MAYGLKGPDTGFVGDSATVEVKENNATCASCDLRITDPTGKILTGRTDAYGNFALPLMTTGIYHVAYMKNNTVMKTLDIRALPRATIPEEKPPTLTLEDAQAGFLWLILLLLIIIVLIIWRRRKKGEKTKPVKKQPKK
jgi:LPXTG-motif cell wall-anchored protein